MLNPHQSYKPPSSWSIMFWSGIYPRQFICMKKFRSLVIPGGGCRKGIIIQRIIIPKGVLPNGQLRLIKKGDITGAYVHATIQRNSLYR